MRQLMNDHYVQLEAQTLSNRCAALQPAAQSRITKKLGGGSSDKDSGGGGGSGIRT
jgi:hypothetical protein